MTALTARQEEVQALALKYQTLNGKAHPRTTLDIYNKLEKLLESEINDAVRKYKNITNTSDDLTQLARLGLSKSLACYRADVGASFWTLAKYNIVGYIQHECERNNGVVNTSEIEHRKKISIHSPTECKCGWDGEINSELAKKDDGLCEYCRNCKKWPSRSGINDTMEDLGSRNDIKKAEHRISISELLYNLLPEDKSLLLRYCVDKETIEEIAESIGVDKMIVHRRIKKIKLLLGNRAEELGMSADLLLSV